VFFGALGAMANGDERLAKHKIVMCLNAAKQRHS
jgi:hypothetical protein